MNRNNFAMFQGRPIPVFPAYETREVPVGPNRTPYRTLYVAPWLWNDNPPYRPRGLPVALDAPLTRHDFFAQWTFEFTGCSPMTIYHHMSLYKIAHFADTPFPVTIHPINQWWNISEVLVHPETGQVYPQMVPLRAVWIGILLDDDGDEDSDYGEDEDNNEEEAQNQNGLNGNHANDIPNGHNNNRHMNGFAVNGNGFLHPEEDEFEDERDHPPAPPPPALRHAPPRQYEPPRAIPLLRQAPPPQNNPPRQRPLFEEPPQLLYHPPAVNAEPHPLLEPRQYDLNELIGARNLNEFNRPYFSENRWRWYQADSVNLQGARTNMARGMPWCYQSPEHTYQLEVFAWYRYKHQWFPLIRPRINEHFDCIPKMIGARVVEQHQCPPVYEIR